MRVFVAPRAPDSTGNERCDQWLVRFGAWFLSLRPVSKAVPQRLNGADHENSTPHHTPLLALTTGRVQALYYRPGVSVPAHETLVLVESLGQFIPHATSHPCQVVRWNIQAEDRVRVGQVLAEIEMYKPLARR